MMTAFESFLTVLRPVDERHKGAKTLFRKSDGSIESFTVYENPAHPSHLQMLGLV